MDFIEYEICDVYGYRPQDGTIRYTKTGSVAGCIANQDAEFFKEEIVKRAKQFEAYRDALQQLAYIHDSNPPIGIHHEELEEQLAYARRILHDVRQLAKEALKS